MTKSLPSKKYISQIKVLLVIFHLIGFCFSGTFYNISPNLYAQINIAPLANVNSHGCLQNPCHFLNNQDTGVCGVSQVQLASLPYNPPSPFNGEFIEWEWNEPVAIQSMVFYWGYFPILSVQNHHRFTGATLQYWTGSSWQNHFTFSGLDVSCSNSIHFPQITAKKIRLINFVRYYYFNIPPQFHNFISNTLNLREIEIFSGSLSENDAGVLQLTAPPALTTFCAGSHNVIARVANFGVNQINNLSIHWEVNGVSQPNVNYSNPLDTQNGTGPWFADVPLGALTFNAGTDYNLVVWTSQPNGQPDTINYNDTIQITIRPAMIGNYTLNAAMPTAGTNFQSFNDLSNALTIRGVCGPVTVNVMPNSGPYNERVTFNEIRGASHANTITVNGNGNVLSFTATQIDDRNTLSFIGTDHFIIDSLNVQANGTAFGTAIYFTSRPNYNTVKNCSLYAASNSSSDFVIYFQANNLPNQSALDINGNHNLIENNIISGGNRGISFLGGIGVKNKIINNTFENFSSSGLRILNQDSIIIEGNTINGSTATTSNVLRGMEFLNTINHARVSKNRIKNSTVNFGNLSAHSFINNHFSNNLMYGFINTGNKDLIFLSSAQGYWDFLHNTLHLNSANSSPSAITSIFLANNNNPFFRVKNNVFVHNDTNAGSQYFYRAPSLPGNAEFGNNVYYSTNAGILINTNPSIQTFSDWQAQGFDTNSVFINPNFVGGTVSDALRPQNIDIKGLGENFSSIIPDDFEGWPRTPKPTPGAFELPPLPGIDLGILGFHLDNVTCIGNRPIRIIVYNNGGDTVTQFSVEWKVNTLAQTTFTTTGIFPPGWIDTITLGTIGILPNTNFDFEAEIIAPGDIDSTNNYDMHLGLRAGMSGTYTINQTGTPSATEFLSFTDAVEVLTTVGICGPVVFNVTPNSGPYNEQVNLTNVKGVSSTNTITFNGNNNTLEYHANQIDNRHTLKLENVQYTHINNLQIHALNNAFNGFGWAVFLTNNANNITIENCNLSAFATKGSDRFGGIVARDTIKNNSYINNTILGGRYGILLSRTQNTLISGNTINGFADGGIRTSNSNYQLQIKNNEVVFNFSGSGNMFGIGIFDNNINHSNENMEISKNIIYSDCQNCLTPPTEVVGILTPSYFQSNKSKVIFNNKIVNIWGRNISGIETGGNWKILHNTISLSDPTPFGPAGSLVATGLRTPSSSNLPFYGDFQNNIVSISRTNGDNFAFSNRVHAMSSDFNCFYILNGNMNGGSQGMISSLSDWQNFLINDLNSVMENPLFADPANLDFTPTRAAIHQMGSNRLSEVPVDYFSVARTTTPDPGAIKFSPSTCSGPYHFVLDSIQDTTGVFSWNSQASYWVIQYDTIGFDPDLRQGIMDSASVNNGFLISGLSTNTCYDFYVADVCSGDTSLWTGPITQCTKFSNDAELLRFKTPKDRNCGEQLTPIAVEIKNNGHHPITTADVHVEITGAQIINITTTFTGNIQNGDSATFNVGTANLHIGGIYHLKTWVSIPNDEDHTNDTLYLHDVLVVPEKPRFDNLPFCTGDDSVTVFGLPFPGALGYEWYDQATGGSLISDRDTLKIAASTLPNLWLAYKPFSVPSPMQPATCQHIQTIDCNANQIGYIDNFSTTGGFTTNISNLNSGCSPNSYVDYTNQQLDAFPGDTINFSISGGRPNLGNQNFAIFVDWNNNGVFSGANEMVWIGPTLGTMSHNGSFVIPANTPPGEKRMRVTYSTMRPGSPCIVINGETEDYTFIVHGGQPCSGDRAQIDLNADSVPTASFTYNLLANREVEFINTSTPVGTNAFWNFGGLATAFGDTVQFTFPRNGHFHICLFAQNACAEDSVCQTINVFGIGVEKHALQDFNLYPNPNRGQFTIEFNQTITGPVSIEIYSMEGKRIYAEIHERHAGSYYNNFNFQHLSSGVYFIRIKSGEEILQKKVIIGK
ncbi:MAG: T9SS type A sorting domain-containing protein [Cryomorphaceae bacterium]|nr:T9SS type A sorting domain-containing protein [Cryomorphaceae bacterium]